MIALVLGTAGVVGYLLLAFVLGVGALAVALAYALGWALARALESARALPVPFLACATQKRNALLSRRNADGRGVSRAEERSTDGSLEATLDELLDGPGVQNWTPTPALEQGPRPITNPGALTLLAQAGPVVGCLLCPWSTQAMSTEHAVALSLAHRCERTP